MPQGSYTILFDMDGVLVNSEPVITAAAIAGLREFGVNAREEDFLPFTGTGEDRFIGGVSALYGVPFHPDMKKRVYEIYLELVGKHIRIYPGTHPLLKNLNEHHIPYALASSADAVKVYANLREAHINPDDFTVVLSGEDVVDKKPAPDIYLLAASRAQAKPENCIVVEDALTGLAAAHAAGMRCICVTTSFSREELIQAGADWVIDDVEKVWNVLLSL